MSHPLNKLKCQTFQLAKWTIKRVSWSSKKKKFATKEKSWNVNCNWFFFWQSKKKVIKINGFQLSQIITNPNMYAFLEKFLFHIDWFLITLMKLNPDQHSCVKIFCFCRFNYRTGWFHLVLSFFKFKICNLYKVLNLIWGVFRFYVCIIYGVKLRWNNSKTRLNLYLKLIFYSPILSA